jgi:hypothetical protein
MPWLTPWTPKNKLPNLARQGMLRQTFLGQPELGMSGNG